MFKHISIRSKLVVMLGCSAALALIISSAITLYSTFTEQKRQSLRVLHQLTDIITENMRAALAFHDDESVVRLLLPLRNNPHILIALVKDEDDKVVGTYTAENFSQMETEVYREFLRGKRTATSNRFEGNSLIIEDFTKDYMYVIKPIYFEGAFIGSIAIVSDNLEFKEKIKRHIIFQFLVSVLTVAIIVVISIRLQRMFTEPILKLIGTMKDISRTKNYNVLVESSQRDEFDDLYSGFNAMIKEIRQRDEILNSLAITDPLTGLYNRRYAMEKMRDMIVRASRKRERLGVIMIDIDFFKSINDTYGHPIGDMVLKGIALLLLSCAREYDIAARIGGEEFLILCDNSDDAVTLSIAERIRQRVQSHEFCHDKGCEVKVTLSIGAYSLVPDRIDIDTIMGVVDDALYRAKRGGRNRIEMAYNVVS